MREPSRKVRLFSTLPSSSMHQGPGYIGTAIDVARWSEAAGCEGALIYTDNSLLDPWVVAVAVIGATERFAPLVAVQPVYMHPYSVAKLVTSIAQVHGRKVYLNMVAGGFVNDLLALGDQVAHDARYDRLVDYTRIVMRLLEGRGPVTVDGGWYTTRNLSLRPSLPPDLLPGLTVSGSSEAGMAAARALGATAIQYPRPAADYVGAHDLEAADRGIRIGMIARDDASDAWRIAHERFPGDERGRLTHKLAMRVSDSVWHRQLSTLASESARQESRYWLHPFENYRTFCPYLVGSHDEVASAIAEYITFGFRTFITDVPRSPDDLEHIGIALERALQRVGS